MSVVKRLISGSAASWVQILVSLVAQIALIPLYLSHWSSNIYGLWLAIIAFVGLIQVIDSGHQRYLGFEFLKIGDEQPDNLGQVLSSSLPFAIFTGALQIGIAWLLIKLEVIRSVFDSELAISQELIHDAGIVILISVIVFMVFGSIGGILVRLLGALGFYSRMAWWGVLGGLLFAISPVIAVSCGGGILEAGLTLAGTTAIYNLFLYYDMLRLLAKSNVRIQRPTFSIGAINFWNSQVLVLTSSLSMIRTSGVRLVLAPLAGSANLAAFATMRTGANIAYQGLGTITGPLMPELMRVLRERDQEKCEAAFATVWLVLVAVMAPAVVILQVIIEPFFLVWTRGEIDFDPLLFATLSLGVLVFALAQPAMSVITGNNLLRSQLVIAAVSALIVVGGMAVMVPILGILGAGIALLVAELFAALQFQVVARAWLREQGMDWPTRSACIAGVSTCIAAFGMSGIVFFPGIAEILLGLVLIVLGINCIAYWRSLPNYAKGRAKSILGILSPRARAV